MPVPATATRSPPATTVTRISSLKSCASETDFSSKTMPRCSAIVGALTRLTCSSVRPCSAPPITASVSRRVSNSAMRPMKAASMRSTELPSASAIARRPSCAASGRNGPSTSMSSAPIEGMLTAVETTPPVSAATTCSAL